jgi:hypothetical protein
MDHHRGTSHPGFQALLRGVGEGRLWSKLSGTYRLNATPPGYVEARPFHDALVAANPQNLVWGTDWPHPRPEGPVPDAAHLLGVFLDWTKPHQRQPILVDNPSGFTVFQRTREREKSKFARTEIVMPSLLLHAFPHKAVPLPQRHFQGPRLTPAIVLLLSDDCTPNRDFSW